MSTRPPTLREKRRYLLVSVEPAGTPVNQKDLYYTIADATTSLWGDVMAAVVMPAVVAAEGRFVVIRCRRGTERELAIALSTITKCRDVRIALRLVAVSGTIESLRERIRTVKTPDTEDSVPSECTFKKTPVSITQCDGQKVDVIEKGFKNTNRLFLTREDLEEL
ncbi:MAG TPA: Rpp14/Pop5 family protein [Methanoregula sp.]|nr:Rpp14/Pop5 family protein [Methanoregula sp.]